MTNEKLNILCNEEIAKGVYRIMASCDTKSITQPGQFVNIQIEDKFLRRPISICDWDDNSISLIYKVVGEGTDWLSQQKKGSNLDALMPLGNGFKLTGEEQLVVGGGIGCPPLLGVCKKLNELGVRPKIVLGALNKDEVILEEEFQNFGEVFITTDDGSYGEKGLVTDLIKKNKFEILNYVACGPLPMEKALVKTMKSQGKLSLEARMGCGFGACMGCSIETKKGPKRICKDGPVFESEELLW